MDKTTYPGSETDNNETYDHCEFQSTTSNDFVDRWVNLTVEKEVLRGAELREEKLKSYPHLLQCDVVNIDFIKSPCPQVADATIYRKSSPGRKHGKTSPCSPRSNSPYIRQCQVPRCTPQTMYSRPEIPNQKNKCLPRCPMRIAELAVPTKRQCIDTWRNKCDVLPACMVERLRQQVMDERPVVHISDAISCFQRRRTKSLKSISKRSKKVNRETKQKNDRNAEIRRLCAAFADKIAHKLITPYNLNLNPELSKLSKVVANEITNIIQNRKNANMNNDLHKRIHADISDKIAVWIATILEDSSYKLLEEDLRVKHYSNKEDRISTLIGNAYQENSSELENEEGPVLDFIDDLVDNVLKVCEPESIGIVKDDNSEGTSKPATVEFGESLDSAGNNEVDTSTIYTNFTYDTGDSTIITSNATEHLGSKTQISAIQEVDTQSLDNGISEGIELAINVQIQGEINKIIDSITKKNDIAEGVNDTNRNENVKDELDTDFTRDYIAQSPGNSELAKQVESIQDSPLIEQTSSNSNLTDEMGSNTSNQPIELEGDNLYDDFEQSTEESPDEKNKKVKFSKLDIGVGGATGPPNIDSTKEAIENEEEKVPWKVSGTNSVANDLILAPPNDHLLSDADESWPEDIATPVLKPSTSASRSITSLGRILEKDEKLLPSEDEIISKPDEDRTRKGELVDIDKNGEHKELVKTTFDYNDVVVETKNKPDAPQSDSLGKTSQSTSEEMKSSDILENSKNEIVEKAVSKISSEKSGLKSGALDKYNEKTDDYETGDNQQVQKGLCQVVENVCKNIDSGPNLMYKAVQQKIKSSYALPEPKFDYKVHPKNAPSWFRHDKGKGEPSEDSFQDTHKTTGFKDCDIRSWCKDLDRIFVNLEMWSGWVDTACKNLLHLKQKREMNNLFTTHSKRKDAKEWMTFKKNFDKDTVLWRKLNQRAIGRLKYYRDKSKSQLVETKEKLHIKSKGSDAETVMRIVEDIDKMCLWIHRTIVSTEYCMACDCKNPRKM